VAELPGTSACEQSGALAFHYPASCYFRQLSSGLLLVFLAWLVRLVLFLFLVRILTLMTGLMLLLLAPVRWIFLRLLLSLMLLFLVIHEIKYLHYNRAGAQRICCAFSRLLPSARPTSWQ
jgi:hypothetical protein